jgi:hypothetical protein
MKEIKLTQDKVALVDDEDFEELNKYKWHASRAKLGVDKFRPRRNDGIYMSRYIMKAKKEELVDHKNRDDLDCQRHNMRICTKSQNMANQVAHKHTSKYKGVTPANKNKYTWNKWVANIRKDNKPIYLGSYYTEKEAALAYNKKAKELFGEFAVLNIVED